MAACRLRREKSSKEPFIVARRGPINRPLRSLAHMYSIHPKTLKDLTLTT